MKKKKKRSSQKINFTNYIYIQKPHKTTQKEEKKEGKEDNSNNSLFIKTKITK